MENIRRTTCLIPMVLLAMAGFYTSISCAEPVIEVFGDMSVPEGYSFDGIFYIHDTPPNTTTVTFDGGYVAWLNTFDSSQVVVNSGTGSNWSNWNDSTFQMNGGTLSYNDSYDTSTVIMNGGTIGWRISCNYSSFVMNGGIVFYLHANGQATTTLKGGRVDNIEGYEQCVYNVYGTDLFLTNTGARGFGYVSGKWQDGTPFSTAFLNDEAYTHIVLHEIPEPATLSLLVLGGLALRIRSRRKCYV